MNDWMCTCFRFELADAGAAAGALPSPPLPCDKPPLECWMLMPAPRRFPAMPTVSESTLCLRCIWLQITVSTVPRAIRYTTRTCSATKRELLEYHKSNGMGWDVVTVVELWPMRWMRSSAWSIDPSESCSSANTATLARVKFSPVPQAVMLNMATSVWVRHKYR